MPFQNARRRIYRVDLTYEGTPEQVFPLLCPVREYDWIDGWTCEMVYADTGVAEPGCIFRTSFPDVGDEIWAISRYESNRAIEFVRVAWNVAVVKLDIALEPESNGWTRARMTHTYTALSQAGELLIDALTPEVNEQQIRAGQQMLNHYSVTVGIMSGSEEVSVSPMAEGETIGIPVR